MMIKDMKETNINLILKTKINVKILCLVIFFFLFGMNFWLSLFNFFQLGNSNVFGLIYLILSWLSWLIISSIFYLLIDNRKIIYPFILVVWVFFFFFFPVFIYLPWLLSGFILTVLGYELIRKEKKQRIDLCLRKIYKKGIGLILVSACLLVSVVYYYNPLLKLDQNKIEIPVEFTSMILMPASAFINKIIPIYDQEATIEDMLSIGVVLGGSLDLSLIDAKKQELSDSLGVDIKGNETIDMLITNMINFQINQFVGPYSKEISVGIAVALFFLFKFFGKFLWLFGFIISKIVIQMLLFFNFIKKERVSKLAEVLKI